MQLSLVSILAKFGTNASDAILGDDDDGDHVPELGVMGVHEHVQPLQEEIKIRTQLTRSALSDC